MIDSDVLDILEDLNNHYSQLILAVLAVVSALIAFKSFYSEKKRRRIDKAIQLAQFYQEHIIPTSAMINREIQDSKYDEIATKAFSSITTADFTITEAEKYLKENASIDLKAFQNLLYDVKPNMVFSAKISMDNWDISVQALHQTYNEAINKDDKESKLRIEKQIANDVHNDIRQLLNALEWFSMYFVNHIADEKTAYQSIHQTYLGIIRQLYYFLSERNCDAYNKYYTNIIELYNTWQTKSDRMRKREEWLHKIWQKALNWLSKTRHKYH